jgi:hypothetical protein
MAADTEVNGATIIEMVKVLLTKIVKVFFITVTGRSIMEIGRTM